MAAPGNPALLPRGGVRGFPHYGVFMEMNARFRDDMWQYLVDNKPGFLSAVATRLTGPKSYESYECQNFPCSD